MLISIIIENIKRILEANSISRYELAKRLGVKPSEISRMLNDKVISVSKLEHVANALGVGVTALVRPLGDTKEVPKVGLPPLNAVLQMVVERFLDHEAGWEMIAELEKLIDKHERRIADLEEHTGLVDPDPPD